MDDSPGRVITLADERENSLGVDARAVRRRLCRTEHDVLIYVKDFEGGDEAVVSIA